MLLFSWCTELFVMLSSRIKFAVLSFTPALERGAVRVKCLAQEHNTISSAKARTQIARSGGQRTNHEATAPAGNNPAMNEHPIQRK